MISIRSCLVIMFCSASVLKAITAQNFLTKLSAISYESLIQKMNFDLFEQGIQFERDSKQNNIADGYDDSKCMQQFSALQKSLNESEMWAIQVMDASGKTPDGILSGNTISMGDYDQCLAVKHRTTSNNEFYGQYCRMELFVNISAMNAGNIEWRTYRFDVGSIETEELHTSVTQRRIPRTTPSNSLTYGICGPAHCSPEILIEIIKEALVQSNINYVSDIIIPPTSCQKLVKIELQPEDIFAISFLVLIAFIMLVSTVYDIIRTKQKKPKNDALIAFSVYTNASKIMACNRNKSSGEISCLHGIRSLAIFCVVTSHFHDITWYMPMTNANYVFEWITNYYSMVILSTNKAVDVFLFMSGLLLTWSMLKQLRNNNGKFNYVRLYLHRYLRLTPVYAVCILLRITFVKYLGNGPYFQDVSIETSRNCRMHWWPALLYIQNYYNPTQICMGHTWYLSADMQLYVLTPPFVYLLFRYRNKIIPLLLAFCVASSGVVIYFFIKYDFDIKLLTTPEGDQTNALRRRLTYHPTHARAGSWIVGVIFGYILFLVDGKEVHMKKRILSLGWIVSILFLLGSVFGNYPLQQNDVTASPLVKGLYHASPRIALPMAVSFIVFVCHFGYGGIVNWFLSRPQWQPISRLTYTMFLTHIMLLNGFMRQYKTSTYFSEMRAVHAVLGHLALAVMISFVFSLAFEYPVFALEKLLFKRKTPAPEMGKETTAT